MKTLRKNRKLDLLILISFKKPENLLHYYKKRWQVETLFKTFKSSGIDIESTHITDQKVFMIVMLA